MPVQVGRHIAELRQIDLVWLQHLALDLLYQPDSGHEGVALGGCEVGHFADMILPYDAGKAWMGGVVSSNDP